MAVRSGSVRGRAPAWFWLVAVVLLLWGIVGTYGFYASLIMTAADWAKMSAADRHLHALSPRWIDQVYGVATLSGLFGSIALLLRSRWARPLYIVSLIAVIAMFGWMYAASPSEAPVALPIGIAAICLFEIWLVGHAIKRRWVR